jgi:antiviral helicase SLH1
LIEIVNWPTKTFNKIIVQMLTRHLSSVSLAEMSRHTINRDGTSPTASLRTNITAVLDFLQTIPSVPSPASPPLNHTYDLDPYSTLLARVSPIASTSTLPVVVVEPASDNDSAIDWLISSLPSPTLVSQVLEILRSPSSNDDIAESLLELYGYDRIDSVGEAVRRRGQIIREDLPNTLPSHLIPSTSSSSSSSSGTIQQHRTLQAQVTFQTAAELMAIKKAKKANRARGRGKDDRGGEEENEIDLEEWERIREESLAAGPGELFSSNRVEFEDFVPFRWFIGSDY